MKIGGLQKVSLIDFPGKIAATLFTVGCNFLCPFCHNPQLVSPGPETPTITKEHFFSFLKSRINKLDGVTITGGEPTIQPDLIDFITEIKEMGFAVKLDTNGTQPQTLQNLLERGLLDYVAMDIKAPLKKYHILCRTKLNTDKIKESISFLEKSNIPHQFRTTVVPGLLTKEDIHQIQAILPPNTEYKLQPFLNNGTLLDNTLSAPSCSEKELADWLIL